jgi:FkbM family methyltransferase
MAVLSVKRPLLLRVLPSRLQMSVFARLYRRRYAKWLALYETAPLQFAPQVTMRLVPGDIISDYIAFTGEYEPHLTRRVLALARAGGMFVDVGANLGYFTLLWLAANPKNTCVAFEASPRNVELLRFNIERNGLSARVQVISQAAGAAPGKMPFQLGPSSQTGWGGFATRECQDAIEVDVVRVDDIIRPAVPVDLLKIDTEGADAWALMGCDSLLRTRLIKEIWYEEHKPRMQALGIAPSAAQDYLRTVGYAATPHGNRTADMVDWSAVPI